MTASSAEPAESLLIERNLPATPDQVWRVWTEPEHFAAWYGPTGSTITDAAIDLQVGGERRFCMQVDTPGGPRRMWFTGNHLEIVTNERLVYTEAMADEHGTVMTAEQLGLPAGHPTLTEVHVELEADDQGTRMTLTHIGIPPGSPGAAGWAVALDHLDDHLVAMRTDH